MSQASGASRVQRAAFDLVVFDLDGTLIDSRADLAAAANRMLAGYGCPPLSTEAVSGMVGEGARLLVERAVTAAGLAPVPTDALDRFLAAYAEALVVDTTLYEGVTEMLAHLAPHCRLALLTNKPGPHTRATLTLLELAHAFATVVGGGDGWPNKPAPGALCFLIDQAGVTPDRTLMVGDSWVDIATARAARCHAALAQYGFGAARLPRDLALDDVLKIRAPLELVAHVVPSQVALVPGASS